jgi:hypothetical protein
LFLLWRDSIKVDVGYFSMPILPHFAHPMFVSAHSSQEIPRALDFCGRHNYQFQNRLALFE